MTTERLSPVCRKKVKEALEVYREEVESSDLASNTKRTYLRHAETFVRWLHGEFEPGASLSRVLRNRLGSLIFAIAVSMAVLSYAVPSIAASEDDAARIERKFEIRELAREILERAKKRTTEAAKESPTIQENNKVMLRELDRCIEQSDLRLKAAQQGKLPFEILEGRLVACVEAATDKNPNAEILNELREEFIKEELNLLGDTLKGDRRKEIKKAIRELSA